jgi:hypothetical protein
VAVFNDESGVYSFSNTGGYGAPNIDPLTITNATMTIYPFGYVDPIVFTFTIASGIITAATKTDEYGIVTNVFSLLNTVLFPFVDLEMGSALLYGDSGDSVLADGSWRLIYSVTDGTSVYELEAYNYFVCSAKKCKDNTSMIYLMIPWIFWSTLFVLVPDRYLTRRTSTSAGSASQRTRPSQTN